MIDLKRFSMPPARYIEPALGAIVVLLGLAVFIALIQTGREWWMARRITQTYTQLTGVPSAVLSARLADRDEMIKRMSHNRLIAPPSVQLTGVLGDSAIFNNGMTVKVGQSVGDMKITSIGATWVEVETGGQTQKLYVFQPSRMGSSSAPGRPGRRSPTPMKPSGD